MCQFWLNTGSLENAGKLTSPYYPAIYSHNLNCTWMIIGQEGFYINLEIDFFKVYKKKFKKVALIFIKMIIVTAELG